MTTSTLPASHPMAGLTMAEMARDNRAFDAARDAATANPEPQQHPEPQSLRKLWRRAREIWSDIVMISAWPEALLACRTLPRSEHRGLCQWMSSLENLVRALVVTMAFRLRLDPPRRRTGSQRASPPPRDWTPTHAATWPVRFAVLLPDPERKRPATPRKPRASAPKERTFPYETSVAGDEHWFDRERRLAARKENRQPGQRREAPRKQLDAPPPYIDRPLPSKPLAFRLEALRRVIARPESWAVRAARLLARMREYNRSGNSPKLISLRVFPHERTPSKRLTSGQRAGSDARPLALAIQKKSWVAWLDSS